VSQDTSAKISQSPGSSGNAAETGAGAGSTTPTLTQSVFNPRHFIAAMPWTQRTPPTGDSSLPSDRVSPTGEGGGALCWQRVEALVLDEQQDRGLVANEGRCEQQHPPLRHTSSVVQPHASRSSAAAWLRSAGNGMPKAVARYAMSVAAAPSRRPSERQNDRRPRGRMARS
jgi:hypothetical protein